MPRNISLVQQIQIASPCPASWEQMEGDDRKRFCYQCKLHVYNFSAMTTEEGEELIRQTEGRLCGRIYQRADGTIITADCPVGLARLRQRTRWVIARVAAAVLF